MLDVGRTYYRLTFADRDLTMPAIEALVYIGELEADNGRHMHAFQDTLSYVRFGAHLDLGEDDEEICVYLIDGADIGLRVLEIEALADEILAAALRARNLGHPTLTVLRHGWDSAS